MKDEKEKYFRKLYDVAFPDGNGFSISCGDEFYDSAIKNLKEYSEVKKYLQKNNENPN
jgi:hypothetical protein